MSGRSELSGQVVAITGASSGIGEATALACARAGAAVSLAARRGDRLAALAGRIESGGGRALAVTADVGDEQQARGFIERTRRELGRLDALVNNAGVMLLGPIHQAPTEEWRRMIDVNVMGVLYCTHAALEAMHGQRSGHIVNVSSVGGRVVGHWSGVYSATKFALGAFTEALRRESMEAGIRVTLIEPGRVETELREHVRPEVLEEIGAAFAGVTPLKAEEIADAILYALTQPPNVSVSELLVRPASSPM
jgi:NADP-dependent 3-hydroxy acid dehydrogenase YdfG